MFAEIEKAYKDEPSLFDEITEDDLIIAFFPCIRFEAKIPLSFRGESFQQKNWETKKKLEYSMYLHNGLHELYMQISKLVVVCINKGLRLIIENPYTQPHYLTTYWCIRPKIIDKDRTIRGDYCKKPTQYWFVNCEPKQNLIFESLEYCERRTEERMKGQDGKSRTVIRSMIHPQYANRFIREFILEGEG